MSEIDQAIIVPARLASTRFPQKLLHEVKGKPVILWTAERIKEVAPDIPLYFAVDGDQLANLLTSAGFEVVKTSPDHPCGTDRIAEANRSIGAKEVINVQADEPMVHTEHIEAISKLIKGDAEMATLAVPLSQDSAYQNPNHVKVVFDDHGNALYFSRAPIPYYRNEGGKLPEDSKADLQTHTHLGIYAYKADFLQMFCQWKPGRLEEVEKLEMLRALEHGYKIRVTVCQETSIGIDTPENAIAFEQALSAQKAE